ncbi:MAG: transcription antitermination factor NusB [Xenococcaceae cyanobacterium MO_188.B32]|nr:transcription antitermination factor NusB [Xenococcaceae cyanobacterium MO_188.B32]
MPPRKQPRSIARELALLSLSQIKTSSDKLEEQDLDSLVLAAIRTLTTEIQDTLETAAAEVKRGSDRLLGTETRANNLNSAKAMVQDALELTQTAINRLGVAVELPEFVQIANSYEVREYALEIIGAVNRQRQEIEQKIEESMVAWQISRLPQIDRNILTIAVAEILFLEIPLKVAINEAVELAKRYSDEEGHRFINGVLRRVSDRLNKSDRSRYSSVASSE